jgi:urease accessory protein
MMRLCGWTAVALTFAAGPAAAHTFGAHGAGFEDGVAHPLGGLDHILAMFAVGIWAAQRGGADLWRLPLTFMGAMVVGAGLALTGVMLPLVEFGIVGSVALLGLFIALGARLTGGVAYGLVALFALCHGHGHGTELPEAAHPVLYGLGFVLATGTLHALGIGTGLAAKRFGQTAMAYGLRAIGALIALAGVGLLTQV